MKTGEHCGAFSVLPGKVLGAPAHKCLEMEGVTGRRAAVTAGCFVKGLG